ncbi:hypothetical protein IMSAGC008_01428 [Muribaculaceae bacterium]|nr:hypothetical protein IMSAGC008_01428 [Muribaculaceae bacterium]
MEEHCLHATREDGVDVVLGKFDLAVYYDLVTLDGHNLAGVLVHEVFHPCLEHTGGKLAAYHLFEVCLVDLYFFCQAENLDNVLIALEADGTEKCGNG